MLRHEYPIKPMNRAEIRLFFSSFDAAIDEAGSIPRLAREISEISGKDITPAGIRKWYREKRVPPAWALVLDAYCEFTEFLDLVPWLREWANRRKVA